MGKPEDAGCTTNAVVAVASHNAHCYSCFLLIVFSYVYENGPFYTVGT
jgi:hypothetical protein